MARDLPIRTERAGERENESERGVRPRQALAAVVNAPQSAAVLDPASAAPAADEPLAARIIAPAPAGAAPRRWAGFPTRITVETAAFLVLGLLALLTRFWDLGTQAQHHDESLHSYFSWLYYTGQGYQHDPLMHGPFLFHVAALAYLLFGDSDASSRYAAALFSAATVLLPWLLRRELGRWGALIASFMLLTSPSFLYFGRFHRHDVYSAFFTLLSFCAIVRFVAAPRPAWAFVGAAAWGLLFTNKEDFFIVTAIFGAALAIAICWTAARRILWLGAGVIAAFGFVVLVLPRILNWPALPSIPFENTTSAAVRTYVTALVTRPTFLAASLVLIGGMVLVARALARVTGGEGWLEGLFGGRPTGSPVAALHTLLHDRRTLTIAAGLAASIYIVLYTSFFSNIIGIFTGSFGAILYWLAQHDVRRAEQPWYYYLLLMPQYDPLAVFLGGFGVVLTGWCILTHRLFTWAEGPRPFVRGLLAWWVFASIAIYSWAGEKMPWMDIHPVLPMLLLSAAMLGTAVEGLLERGTRNAERGTGDDVRSRAEITTSSAIPRSALRAPRSLDWAVGGLMVAATAAWFLGAARLSYSGVRDTQGWWIVLIPALIIAALAIGYGALTGWGRTGRVTLLAIASAFLLFHIHAGWRLSFERGDVPLDMLVYVQTSPDVTRVMGEIDEFSAQLTGGQDLAVMYDDNTSWPFQWYLRNYRNKRYFSQTLAEPPAEDVAVILVGNENLSVHPELHSMLANYSAQPYEMRWHFPENETYRRFAIAPELGPGWSVWMTQDQPHGTRDVIRSVFSSLTATARPENQAKLFRLLAYRETGAPLGTYGFTVFVRKDLLPQYNAIRYR